MEISMDFSTRDVHKVDQCFYRCRGSNMCAYCSATMILYEHFAQSHCKVGAL
jgi:hypothetical protein